MVKYCPRCNEESMEQTKRNKDNYKCKTCGLETFGSENIQISNRVLSAEEIKRSYLRQKWLGVKNR